MSQTFYQFKRELTFPDLGGTIRCIDDLPALLDLNLECAARYQAAYDAINPFNVDSTPIIEALWTVAGLHRLDAARIRAFMKARQK